MASSFSNAALAYVWDMNSLLLCKRFRLGHLIVVCFVACILYITVISNQQLVSVWSISERFIQREIQQQVSIPRVVDRGTCCVSLNSSKDICDRLNCTFPSCPAPQTLNQLEHDDDERENAFFLETSGSGNLNIRQACAVESLAFHNPKLNVNVLFMDDGVKKINRSKVIETIEKLKEKYNNIHVIVFNVAEYVAGTWLEKWYHCTDWRKGQYHVAHLSDGLRLLTLKKYGGYYFDLDIIFVRPVTYYRNFIVAESGGGLCNNAIHADHGHPVVQLAVKDFAINYRCSIHINN